MVHVGALPGTPKSSAKIEEIVSKALYEAEILEESGVDAIMIENMHDRPYVNRNAGPEIVAAMTTISFALKRSLHVPLGIQILAGANKQALAVALAAGLEFIRAEGFVFGHLADEGWMDSDAAELLRYQRNISAENIQIFTDIKKKHSSHAASRDVTLAETAKAAEFFLSNGVVVTGKTTGEKANLDEVREVKNAVSIPVIIGSGVDIKNIQDYWNLADGFIVGSSFKKEGKWENEIEKRRVTEFMQKIKKLRK